MHKASTVWKCCLYCFRDLGFIPKRNRELEVEVAGAMKVYTINKADHEDGEIILELGALEE